MRVRRKTLQLTASRVVQFERPSFLCSVRSMPSRIFFASGVVGEDAFAFANPSSLIGFSSILI